MRRYLLAASLFIALPVLAQTDVPLPGTNIPLPGTNGTGPWAPDVPPMVSVIDCTKQPFLCSSIGKPAVRNFAPQDDMTAKELALMLQVDGHWTQDELDRMTSDQRAAVDRNSKPVEQ